MSNEFIKNISRILILEPGQSYVKHSITNTTEYNGSVMYSIDIHVKDNRNSDDLLKVIAKTIPSESSVVNSNFDHKTAFLNEITFYKQILPHLQEFRENIGSKKLIDCFPKYYGSLDNGTNGGLLIEKLPNYQISNEPINLDTAKLVLRKLAVLHSTPMALKQLEQQHFEHSIKLFFKKFYIFHQQPDELEKEVTRINKIVVEILKQDPEGKNLILKFLEAFPRNMANLNVPINFENNIREPFWTITHADLSINNNVLFKTENGTITDCKFVDLQLNEYGSLARDVIYFLSTSVEIPVLNQSYDELIQYYYDNLIENLKKQKCTIEPFNLDEFKEEIYVEANRSQLGRVIKALCPEGFVQKDRILFILKKFDEHNWL